MSERYLLRIEGSGVWLDCELLPSDPGILRWRGRRAWRWRRTSVDTSDLAEIGPGPDSMITREVTRWTVSSRLIEGGPMSERAIAAVRAIAPAEPRR